MSVFLPHWFTFFCALIISFFDISTSGFIGGEMGVPLTLGQVSLFLFFMLNIVGFLMVLFLAFCLNKFRVKTAFNLVISNQRFLLFYGLILVFDLVFTNLTGTGVLFQSSTSSVAFLGAILNPVYLLPIFYLKFRYSLNKVLFFFFLILFSLSQFQKGWTGFLLLLFFLELVCFLRGRRSSFVLFCGLAAPIFVLFFGAFIYQLVIPIKEAVRGQPERDVSYAVSLEALSSRLTFFPVAVAGVQEANAVAEFYLSEDKVLKEAWGFFKPILPSFLMNDKDFRSLNNNVKQPYFEIDGSTSADLGFVAYNYILSLASVSDLIFSILLTLLALTMLKVFYDLISEYPSQFDFLIYLVIFSVFYTASNEHVFSRNLLGVFYLLPLMLGLKVIRINKLKAPDLLHRS